MSNIYYSPEKFGLTQVACIDFSDGDYQFSYLAVWKDSEGNLYYAEDSGCSCPAPFEDFNGIESLTRVQSAKEIVSRMKYRAEESPYDYESGRIKAEVADFKSKVKRGEI
jgi:hypothetical protein